MWRGPFAYGQAGAIRIWRGLAIVFSVHRRLRFDHLTSGIRVVPARAAHEHDAGEAEQRGGRELPREPVRRLLDATDTLDRRLGRGSSGGNDRYADSARRSRGVGTGRPWRLGAPPRCGCRGRDGPRPRRTASAALRPRRPGRDHRREGRHRLRRPRSRPPRGTRRRANRRGRRRLTLDNARRRSGHSGLRRNRRRQGIRRRGRPDGRR
jgi:hypothetical protein